MNQDLIQYIENKILLKYRDGAGHSLEHIEYVINRSLKFAEQAPEADKNMCYVIAAYHDIGRLIDDHYHEKISAAFLKMDENLQKFFSVSQIETMAEAVEDHRASSKHEPRSIYGKIVSSADRSTSSDAIIKRSVETHLHSKSDADYYEAIEEARQHVLAKQGKDGYARQKMFFDDPDFIKACDEVAAIAADFITFKQKYESLK